MCTRRPNRRVQHVVRSERDELPRVALIRVRKLVVDGDRRRRRVEVLLDIVEAEDLTGGRHIQRAVAYRDAVRLTEPRGNRDHALGFVVAVAIDDGIDVARVLRTDEHGALRAQRHHARVGDVLSENLELETRRNNQGSKRPRGLLRQDGKAGAKGRGRKRKDEPPCGSLHGVSPNCVNRGALPLGLPNTLSRAPLRRRAPFAWLARGARLAPPF